jgi:hypothetical protein
MAEAKEVAIAYERASDYRIIPANGVYGGPTPQGDFRLEFYVEGLALPTEAKHTIVEGKLTDPTARPSSEMPRLVRQIQMGVLLSEEQTRNLAAWLLKRLAEVDKVKSEEGPRQGA